MPITLWGADAHDGHSLEIIEDPDIHALPSADPVRDRRGVRVKRTNISGDEPSQACLPLLQAIGDYIEICSQHKQPVVPFPDEKKKTHRTKKTRQPCYEAEEIGDDTVYHGALSEALCGSYRRTNNDDCLCGAATCFGGCGLKLGCNKQGCACLGGGTCLCISLTGTLGPDDDVGCLSVALDFLQCSVLGVGRDSLGCLLGAAKQNIHACGQEISIRGAQCLWNFFCKPLSCGDKKN